MIEPIRDQLDTGQLGVVAVSVDSAAQAAGLLAGRHSRGLRYRTGREVVIDSDAEVIPVGIDGEAVLLPTPVRCTIQPGALRVRLPRQRAETPRRERPIDVAVLLHEAVNRRAS
jgi:diacylglycerol kinase family enzyme